MQTVIKKALKSFLPPKYYAWLKSLKNRAQGRSDEIEVNWSSFIGGKKNKFSLNLLPSFRAEHFPRLEMLPWLDQPDFKSTIQKKLELKKITPEEAKACENYAENGYLILPRLLSEQFVDRVFSDYLNASQNGVLKFNPGDRRFLNPHLLVPSVNELLKHDSLLKWIKLIFGGDVVPFQTIGAEFGSGQLAHSDAIHMTTHPHYYMAAAWVACEDISPESGPLVYYPGSHRLPLYLSKEVGILENEFKIRGYDIYSEKYEPFIAQKIQELKLKPFYFEAKKGDVLIWHYNLIHGGSTVKNPELTRKSIVAHYFSKGVICYHDLAGVLAEVSR